MKVNIEKPLTQADVKTLRKWEILLIASGVCGLSAVMPAFGCWVLGSGSKVSAIFTLVALLCGLLFLVVSMCSEVYLDDTWTVSKSQCAELLQVFKEWPEVEPYRQAVLKEGREFVTGEIEALKVEGQRLRQEQSDRQKCQALYQA